MSLKTVPAGKYRAKATEGAWARVGEKQTPAVGVKFEFDNGGQKESIWHVMYLTQTALKDGSTVAQKTFETLTKLGYDETKELTKDATGNLTFGRSHLTDKEVEIVIEINEKNYHTVKYVNELGGSNLQGISVEQVLGAMNLKSEMAAARARLGVTKTAPKTEIQPEIPF